MPIPSARTFLAAFLLAPLAAAQGSDSCTTAQSIAGYQTFAYVCSSATTGSQGQSQIECNSFGQRGIFNDVWFRWTAPATERVWVRTCGLTTGDTKMALYDGAGCPSGAPIGCADDTCGQQSSIVFDATAGMTYTLQIGFGSQFGGGANGGVAFATAPPLTPCGTNTGPDIVVSALPGLLNFATASGLDAYSVGSTGTNVGDEIANWIAETNDHPVIRHNTYGFRADGAGSRFEHLGLSWLKHGFGAEQASSYCACNPGGNFRHLGVGCSDTYLSSQSGFQPDLHPNWQVNAHTGVYTWPPADPPITNSMSRLCQMPLASLAPTSATRRFLAEVQYVTKDDATAGNQNNNASWQHVGVSGGPLNFTFSLTGAVTVGESAIRAWPTLDPAVVLTDAQIPGDGLVVVGSRAWSSGGSTWSYEYAVYNMNADRNVGRFSVPVPAGATITNVGFHDVAHHSGDGIGSVNASSVDWVGVVAGGALTWACVPESVDPNANAIRWGSLYNFRFDADVAPESGLVSFEPWKPGAPAQLTAVAQVPISPAITGFCAGDATGTPCPCGNSGAAGRGCENSFATGGAQLTGTGATSVANDQLRLSIAGLPTGGTLPVLFFQGDAPVAGGAGSAFGDGLRCAGGTVVRLGTRNASGGALDFGAGVPGDPSIAVQGGVPPGSPSVRLYQAWYRNAAAFCTASTFNLTNGLRVVWSP